jgi:hypothetical protein
MKENVRIWFVSEAKNLCGPSNYEILRRLAPQNDTHKRGFQVDSS